MIVIEISLTSAVGLVNASVGRAKREVREETGGIPRLFYLLFKVSRSFCSVECRCSNEIFDRQKQTMNGQREPLYFSPPILPVARMLLALQWVGIKFAARLFLRLEESVLMHMAMTGGPWPATVCKMLCILGAIFYGFPFKFKVYAELFYRILCRVHS